MANQAHTCFRRAVARNVFCQSSSLTRQDRVTRKRLRPEAGRHYNTARKQRQGQKDLQDLLIDPQYDALFDGDGDDPQKDPFSNVAGPKKRQSRQSAAEVEELDDIQAFMEKRRREMQNADSQADKEEDEDDAHEEKDDNLSYIELMKKYQRHNFLQQQQDEIMTHHHRMRASEVPPYAQATVLAGLLEQYDNMDEYLSRHPQEAKGGNPWLNAWKMIEDPDQNLDGDFMPAWIRAKRAIVKNWDEIEELNGNRQRTIDRIREFTELSPERQHQIDTWDPALYKGTPDPEVEYEDYLDKFLAISEKTAELEEQEEGELDTVGSAFVDELLEMDPPSDDED